MVGISAETFQRLETPEHDEQPPSPLSPKAMIKGWTELARVFEAAGRFSVNRTPFADFPPPPRPPEDVSEPGVWKSRCPYKRIIINNRK
jgi:hypothetical protein